MRAIRRRASPTASAPRSPRPRPRTSSRVTSPAGSASAARARARTARRCGSRSASRRSRTRRRWSMPRSRAAARIPSSSRSLQNVQVGESHKVAVLEMSGRPNWWRVWLDGKSRSRIPSCSRTRRTAGGRSRPAESWNGGRAVCNTFAFRFDGVGVAAATGGSWRPFAPGFKFQDRGFGVKRLSAAPGTQRTLSGGAPTPYASKPRACRPVTPSAAARAAYGRVRSRRRGSACRPGSCRAGRRRSRSRP